MSRGICLGRICPGGICLGGICPGTICPGTICPGGNMSRENMSGENMSRRNMSSGNVQILPLQIASKVVYVLKSSRYDVNGDGVVYFAALIDRRQRVLSGVVHGRLRHLYEHLSVHVTHRDPTAVGLYRCAVLIHCHLRLRLTWTQRSLSHHYYSHHHTAIIISP